MGTSRQISVQKVLEELRYSALHWPGKTVRLRGNTVQDYLNRPASHSISIAELFHENSNLHPSNVGELLASCTDIGAFKRRVLEEEHRCAVRSRNPPVAVPGALGTLLSALKSQADPSLFYAIEVRVLLEDRLLSWDAPSAMFPSSTEVGGSENASLQRAIRLLAPGLDSRFEAVVFVIGWFARNDILFGPRGYRRTLFEAGSLTQELLRCAATLNVKAAAITEFIDVDLNAVLDLDGVEEGVVAVVPISWDKA
jgi:hypothetical protein